MSENKIRYAVVSKRPSADAEGIARYLPANYRVVADQGDQVIVAGYDNAGWTMDGYVLPRLGSGLIAGHKIFGDEIALTVPQPTQADEDKAWRDAYHINYPGASNPRGVQHTLDELVIRHHIPLDHAALNAIQGHLDYLNGHGLGPELAELDAVRFHARRLGLEDEHGNYVPESERAAFQARGCCPDCDGTE